MNSMTLVKAFRLRNLLKSKLNELTYEFQYAPKSWDEGDVPDYNASGGKTAELIVEQVNEVQTILSKFNVAINIANQAKAQAVMISINTANDLLHFLETAYELAKKVQRTRLIENRITGESRKIVVNSGLDAAKLKGRIDRIKKDKFNYETVLSEINATQNVFIDTETEAGLVKYIGEIGE